MDYLKNKTIEKATVEEKSFNGEEVLNLFLKMTDGTLYLIKDFEEISLLKEVCK
jgi:hypothetical protein